MNVNTTRSGFMGAGYVDTNNVNRVLENHVNVCDVPAVMYWLGRLDTLAELRFGGQSSMVDFASAFTSAVKNVQLSDRESTVFDARFDRQLSIGETAVSLGISRQAVTTYCRRIARKMVKTLGGETS